MLTRDYLSSIRCKYNYGSLLRPYHDWESYKTWFAKTDMNRCKKCGKKITADELRLDLSFRNLHEQYLHKIHLKWMESL